MCKYLLPVLILLLVYDMADCGVLRLETHEESDVTIRYEEPLHSIVPQVLKVYPLSRETLKRKLNLDLTLKPVIVLIHSDAEFNRMAEGNRLVKAFATSDNIIAIDFSKMERNPFDLELTITHELCHLLLRDYIKPHHLPRWLNEGVSQWVSGGMSDIINFDGKKLLKQAVLTDNYLPLEDISWRFPVESNLFILSYEESKSIVEYIDEEYGTDKLLLVLENLRKGDPIQEAILNTLSVDLNKLEHDWHAYLRRKYTWFSYFADNLLWILFSGAALLTVIGFLRLRIRMRTHFQEDDDDEDEIV